MKKLSACLLTQASVSQSESPRMGLVAGWGSFPVEIAQRCKQAGIELHVVGLQDHAAPELIELADSFCWMGVAKLGGHIRFFQRAGVQQVALAGKLFKHRLLYQKTRWIQIVPDWTCITTMASIFLTRARDGCDDTILGSVVEVYQRKGIRIMTIQEAAPSLLVGEGVLVGRKPSFSQLADIRFGWRIARHMGGLDIGQCITVKDQIVLGVEAIEGTDGLIERTGQLCSRGGFTLVKLSKPQQDMRFDVPAIGPGTVEQMAAAGGKIIAIEAGKTILLDRQQTLETAQRMGVTIVAFADSQLQHTELSSGAAA